MDLGLRKMNIVEKLDNLLHFDCFSRKHGSLELCVLILQKMHQKKILFLEKIKWVCEIQREHLRRFYWREQRKVKTETEGTIKI